MVDLQIAATGEDVTQTGRTAPPPKSQTVFRRAPLLDSEWNGPKVRPQQVYDFLPTPELGIIKQI